MCPVKKNWKEYLEEIIEDSHNDLTNEISVLNDGKKGLCCLKNVNFNYGGQPNYRNQAEKFLYLLRYAPAYTVEYRAAFEEILKGNHIIPGDIVILSIGCGAFIDKASAYYAMKRYIIYKKYNLIYYGVDIENWGKDMCPWIKLFFINKGIEKVKSTDINKRIDIIIFPKSLSEIDEGLLNKFLGNLSNDDLENEVCIVNSNRESYNDSQKAHNFMCAFSKNFDYKVTKQIDITPSYKNHLCTQKPIWTVFEHFCFSQYAINASKDVYELCANKSEIFCGDICRSVINRFPMLNTKYH
jgi:hypothetical protein